MQKIFLHFLETRFAPRVNKVAKSLYVGIVKDSIMQVMPLIFLGSLFAMLTIPGNFLSKWPNFWDLFGWTFGLVSVFIAFLIPFNLMEKRKKRDQRISAGISGLILFFMSLNPQFIMVQKKALEKGGNIAFSAFTSIEGLSSGGMLTAILAGVVAGLVWDLLNHISFFNDESAVPDFVQVWFNSMLPVGIITILGWVLTAPNLLNLNLYQLVVQLFTPLQKFFQTPWGMMFSLFLSCFVYSIGISPWILTPVQAPIIFKAMEDNALMVQAGTATVENLNLYTYVTVYSGYIWIGGIAATLSLAIIMLCFSKSQRMKSLGRAAIGPSIFNINEPIVFGCIAWNPIMMIPMWLQGIILPLVTYLFTKVLQIAPIPSVVFSLWYTPFPISTWLVTRSFWGLLLLAINFAISWFIWLPFFKVYDTQVCREEQVQQS